MNKPHRKVLESLSQMAFRNMLSGVVLEKHFLKEVGLDNPGDPYKSYDFIS